MEHVTTKGYEIRGKSTHPSERHPFQHKDSPKETVAGHGHPDVRGEASGRLPASGDIAWCFTQGRAAPKNHVLRTKESDAAPHWGQEVGGELPRWT